METYVHIHIRSVITHECIIVIAAQVHNQSYEFIMSLSQLYYNT